MLEAGGYTPAECTRRVLATMFTKKCAQNMNWCGRNREELTNKKVGLKGLTLSQVMINVIRNRFEKTTTDVIEKSAMNWLRNSRDMLGGRKDRRRGSTLSQMPSTSQNSATSGEEASIEIN